MRLRRAPPPVVALAVDGAGARLDEGSSVASEEADRGIVPDTLLVAEAT